MARAFILALLVWLSGFPVARADSGPRDRIEILSTPESFEFASAISRSFAKARPFSEPSVESLDDAMSRFCSSVGLASPDYVFTVREMSEAEQKQCKASGVTPVDVSLGGAGLVVLRGAELPSITLSRRDLYRAIASSVPAGDGDQLATNGSRTWKDIKASLPDRPIEIIGPAEVSTASQTLKTLVLAAGARSYPGLAALEVRDASAFHGLTGAVRPVPAYRPLAAGESVADALARSPSAVVIGDFTALQSSNSGRTVEIEGVPARASTVVDGSYPLALPVRLILKREHVGIVPGLEEFLDEALGSEALSESGYLRPIGLIPAPRGKNGVTAGAILARTR